MPDHLVEKAARALSAKWNSRGGRCIYPANSKPEDWIDSGDAQAVLSALSGDLVAREEAATVVDVADFEAAKKDPKVHAFWADAREFSERLRREGRDHSTPDVVPRSQADALAGALGAIATTWTNPSHPRQDVRYQECVRIANAALASYRKTTSGASGETEGEG